ncbi:MAG: GxxExxY protein [Planctomycetota bacterium]
MDENAIAQEIVDAAYHVHVELGPGLLESVYEAILDHELRRRGLDCIRQKRVPIKFRGVELDEAFRLDLLVNDLVIVEIKSVEQASPVHAKQVLTYLRLTDKRLGLLLNFGQARMKDGIERIANGLPD